MLKELKTQHREIARLRFEGVKPTEIAKRLQMAATSVYAILRDPICKSYLAGLHDRADTQVIDVRKSLAEMQMSALGIYKKVLENKSSDNIKIAELIKVADQVLDRTGYKAPEQHNHAHAILTADDILKLKERADDVNTDYITIN